MNVYFKNEMQKFINIEYDNITIEPMIRFDAESIISMLQKERISYLFNNPTVDDYINSNTITFAIKLNSKKGKKLVGCVSAAKLEENTTARCLWGLYVKKEYRRHGIASSVLREFVTLLMSLGVTYLYGICNLNNSEALDFYKKRFMFLKKDGTIGKLKDDLSNLSDFYIRNNEIEVAFGLVLPKSNNNI